MIRALITAVLLAGAANQTLAAPPEAALGYSLLLCFTLWFTWPALRWAIHQIRRHHRRRATARPPTATPHLTQINHHHYYYAAPPLTPPRIDHTLLALPRRTRQQQAHDAVYNTIDLDDNP